ncbi:MAG: response regulator transcription factor [Cyanobacteria bacterium NC_groundwater_1444_Ag_S-0.65um_54_12]|nr:response regulator transcription factor [Cyanobacteria bacterium NC_groundwater_1444_Ag_S-0.65um_54_12]
MSKKLLLIDDDQELAHLLEDFLSCHGYTLWWSDRLSAAHDHLLQQPDLILLDIMLPEQSGFEVCSKLRSAGNPTPIIMLTARNADPDKIHGLRLGADDYLPKPFNPLELLARIEAVLRRTGLPETKQAQWLEDYSGPRLDPDRRMLYLADREVVLTPYEYRLLEAMIAAPGRVFSRDQMLDLLDDTGTYDSFDRAIDIHVSRLRNKIEANPRQPEHLITVRGVGYRFEC